MIAVVLDRGGRQAKVRRGAIDRAQDLRERHVEIAQSAVRGFLLVVLLLGLGGQPVLPVPQLMRERAVLRDQQQGREHNLHQAALQHHRNTPRVYDRDKVAQRSIRCKIPRVSPHLPCFILAGTAQSDSPARAA